MAEPSTPTPGHPLLVCLAEVEAALDKAAGVEPVFAPLEAKAEVLRRLALVEARAAGLRLRVMAAAGDVAEQAGARDVGDWYAHEVRADHAAARSDLKLARALDQRQPVLATALSEGRCTLEQARVITKALDDLPDNLEQPLVEQAETHLIDLASRFAPTQLRVLGAKILHVLAPEIAEAEDGKKLLAQEQRAADKTSLTITDAGDGTCFIKARVPIATGTRLRTLLDAFTQPRVAKLTEQGKPIRYHRLRGQAFCQLLERIDPDTVPDHGGDATTIIVTIPIDQLLADLGTATVGTGTGTGTGTDQTDLSASEARRLACEAGLIPAVLGTHSEVLDLGRKHRLFTPAQRNALRIRYATCAADGCDIPNTWTDAHHLDPWSQGGNTNLEDGVLLCRHHHQLAHNPHYQLTRHPDGSVTFHRRS